MKIGEDGREAISVTEARDFLGVSNRTMARLVREGTVSVQVDPLDRRRKLVKVSDLQGLIEKSGKKEKAKNNGSS